MTKINKFYKNTFTDYANTTHFFFILITILEMFASVVYAISKCI